jgi:polyhydroxyalkanoate synthesis regulator phasin
MDRATRPYPQNAALIGVANIENLLLFVDDDLRETALAMHHIEQFLMRTLGLLEAPSLRREQVQAVASDTSVLDHMDMLNETIESLRRRLARLSARLK